MSTRTSGGICIGACEFGNTRFVIQPPEIAITILTLRRRRRFRHPALRQHWRAVLQSPVVHCKQADSIEPKVWSEFTRDAEVKQGTPAKPIGCIECRQTGFYGRIGLYEMLEMTDAFKAKVKPDGDLQSLREQAKADGIQILRTSGAKKVASGLTTIDEVLRVTPIIG